MSCVGVSQERIPSAVLEACKTLQGAGFQAWIVGGAVRDLLLGKTPVDWDVASDALPGQVMTLFSRTIPTGVEHGTVTAILGVREERRHVEITTFRAEGAYSDARRPDTVHFGVSLDEDLSRRDFVINAIAYDPIADALYDPLGGEADLLRRSIRAVGVARERFAEDGLRVMRAVRFVGTLDFDLDAATESALSTALDALSKVAMERVRVELVKLLGGCAASRGLMVAERNQVLSTILPELEGEGLASSISALACAPRDAILRLALVLRDVETGSLDGVLRRLTMSNGERRRIVAMLAHCGEFTNASESEKGLRIFLSRVGRSASPDALSLLAVDAEQRGDTDQSHSVARARAVLASGVPLEVADLAISGSQIIARTSARGKQVGTTLQALLGKVLDDPTCNELGALEREARILAGTQDSRS